jgi:urease accessory protein
MAAKSTPRLPWLLLQLSDSALPTGGFAHSGGLESIAQQSELKEAVDLQRFLRDALWQVGHFGLPLVAAAHENPSGLASLDARADAFLANRVANRASRTQGRAFLDTCARIFPEELAGLRDTVREQGLRQHHAPIFGAALKALGVDCLVAQQLFLSLSLRGLLFAAVRLGLAGTHQAQRMQHDLAPAMDAVLQSCADLREHNLAQTAPLADLFGSMHDRLYSRIFQS